MRRVRLECSTQGRESPNSDRAPQREVGVPSCQSTGSGGRRGEVLRLLDSRRLGRRGGSRASLLEGGTRLAALFERFHRECVSELVREHRLCWYARPFPRHALIFALVCLHTRPHIQRHRNIRRCCRRRRRHHWKVDGTARPPSHRSRRRATEAADCTDGAVVCAVLERRNQPEWGLKLIIGRLLVRQGRR